MTPGAAAAASRFAPRPADVPRAAWTSALLRPVAGGSLAAYRLAFGVTVAVEVAR